MRVQNYRRVETDSRQGGRRCTFNGEVFCAPTDTCGKCGWNPEVNLRRRAQIRKEGGTACSDTRRESG